MKKDSKRKAGKPAKKSAGRGKAVGASGDPGSAEDAAAAGASGEISAAAANAIENVKDAGAQAANLAANQVQDNLSDQAKKAYDDAWEMSRQWRSSVESYVQQEPVKSVLIAAGIGFLAGVFWKRR